MQVVDDFKELMEAFSWADLTNPVTPEQWLASAVMLGGMIVAGWLLLKMAAGALQ